MFWALLSMTQSFYYAPPVPVLPASQEEAAFLQVINDFRGQLNLQKLTLDDRLEEAAQGHASWMSSHHLLTHVGPKPWWKSYTRMYAAGIPMGLLVGENIASGSFTAKNTFIQWFFSPAHLEGMLNPDYDHIGIARAGCDDSDQSGLCYWVTDFAQLNAAKDPVSQSESPDSKPQILNAAEKVVGQLDEAKKARFLNPTIGNPSGDVGLLEE